MKKTLCIAMLAVLLASCAGDENANPVMGPSMTYQKIEIYAPSKADYEDTESAIESTRNVRYFTNGLVTADTTFNKNGGVAAVTTYTTGTATKTITSAGPSGTISLTYTYNYDTQGRITAFEKQTGEEHYKNTYVYNSDLTVTNTLVNLGTGESIDEGSYTINSSGLVSNYDRGVEHTTINYTNGVPVSYTYVVDNLETITRAFTYYDTAVPANHRPTPIQYNNTVLTLGIDSAPDNTSYYHKGTEDALDLSSTFNTAGYITHTFYHELINNNTFETFYYYNEE